MRRVSGFLFASLTCLLIAVVAGGCSRSSLDYLGGGEYFGDDGGLDANPYGDDVVIDVPIPDSLPPPHCGNGVCDQGETCSDCPVDCGLCSMCGNGVCNENENCANCPQDCGACPRCGDGKCQMPEENCLNCPQDCGMCPGCGDGKCTPPNETCYTCPQDCGQCQGCGDGKCDGNETCASCPMDCGVCVVCGNGVCQKPYETCSNCPQDCGQCVVKDCAQILECSLGCFSFMSRPPMFNYSCFVNCGAEGCPSAQYFANQAINCFIDNLFSGQCSPPSLSCLMQQCQSQIAACFGNACPPGQQ